MNRNHCFPFLSVFLLQLSVAYFTEVVADITNDRTALLVLKASITADPYNFMVENWNNSSSVCSWAGETCDYRHGRVMALDLSYMNLAGVIPKEIGSLTMLQKLNLEYNNFIGILPDEIGALNKIQNISISHNYITGSIPRSIGNCTELREINFSGNNLTGIIPPEIGLLRHLEILRIRDNHLSGNIPLSLFNISTLKTISAQSNSLSGILPLTRDFQLPNLEELFLGGNQLEGTLSPSISNASKLAFLDLYNNSFSGAFPATLDNLRLLQVLNLADNGMARQFPDSSFLSSLSNCRKLRKLTLSRNSLNDTLASIANFSSTLEEFSANNCNLKGRIPGEIGNFTRLISLNLGNNGLTGDIPADVGRLGRLQVLRLQFNRLVGTIPDLCDMNSLYEVNLGGNKIVGSIPECLGNLMSLSRIDLSLNRLTSTVPLIMWRMDFILSINISSNSLNGSLPFKIMMESAKEIDLSNNLLSGKIPNFGTERLVFLSLANNGLTGFHSLDSFYAFSQTLEFLDLSRNKLSGEILEDFKHFRYLRYFNVSYNELEGEIPASDPFTNFSDQSFMWNKALCGAGRLLFPPCNATIAVGVKKGTHLFIWSAEVIMVITLILTISWSWRKKSGQLFSRINFSTIKRFSFLELKHATDTFSEVNLIGRGSFSSVYRGILQDGKIAAIKVFNLEEETSLSSFEVERKIMHSTCHRNLIRILFSFSNTQFKALVMEYMSKGTLEKWIHTHNYHLDIHRRLDIMIDTASAVKYLHHDYKFPVIHCDLKPTNILLDEDLIAHVADFGSAKLFDTKFQNSAKNSTVMYTIGYVAPEYGLNGAVSTKSDVYSFGILLMETFTGKKPTSEMFYGEMSLRNWVSASFPTEVEKVTDPSLLWSREGRFDAKIECIRCIMRLALCCSSESPLERPDMKQVELMLNRIKDLLIKNISRD